MPSLPLVVDHYDDGGLLLRVLFSEAVPPIIKVAADLSSMSRRDPGDYALVTDGPFGREYRLPCVDAGNTLASALYFAKHGHELPPELQKEAGVKLHAALLEFGFTPPAELEKVASTDAMIDYIMGDQVVSDDLAFRRLFELDDGSAYEEIKDEFAGLSPTGKRRLALQIKEAGALASAPEGVAAYAADSFGTDIEYSLEARAAMAPNADVGALKVKIAAARATGDVEGAAQAIHVFDVSNGLTAYYGRPLPDQYASVLGRNVGTTIEKAASGDLEIDGRTISSERVRAFSVVGGGKLADVFGDDFSAQFSADPVSVLTSLPAPHQKAIARMMDDTGT